MKVLGLVKIKHLFVVCGLHHRRRLFYLFIVRTMGQHFCSCQKLELFFYAIFRVVKIELLFYYLGRDNAGAAINPVSKSEIITIRDTQSKVNESTVINR